MFKKTPYVKIVTMLQINIFEIVYKALCCYDNFNTHEKSVIENAIFNIKKDLGERI